MSKASRAVYPRCVLRTPSVISFGTWRSIRRRYFGIGSGSLELLYRHWLLVLRAMYHVTRNRCPLKISYKILIQLVEQNVFSSVRNILICLLYCSSINSGIA